MVAPLSLVVDVDSMRARAGGFYDRRVLVDNRQGNKLIRLLALDFHSRCTNRPHLLTDACRVKLSRRASGCGRIGNPQGTQGAQVDFVVATKLKFMQASPPRHSVIGDIQ